MNESVVNEWTRPRKWLGRVELVHYLWGGFGLLVFGMMALAAVLQMAERFSNWGTVSKWEVNYAANALLGLSYSVAAIYSGKCMERRRRRHFSVALGLAHVLTVIGIPLALFTWLVLTRESVKEVYRDAEPRFAPRLFPPPLPKQVLPAMSGEHPVS